MLVLLVTGTHCTSQLGCKKMPSRRNCPLQYEHCSYRPEKILSSTTTGESSHHYISTAVAAGWRTGAVATTAGTMHSHCLSQQVPILLPVGKYEMDCVLQILHFLCNVASSLFLEGVWQHRVSPRICATL